MAYNLVASDNAILYRKLEPFDFETPPVDPIDLANALIETMRKGEGLGLSANQVGLPYRVFVMEGSPAFVCFNPAIVAFDKEQVELMEGCMTHPDLWLKIKRPLAIRARFTTPTGETVTKVFGGYHARVFQHQLDILNGLSYTTKVHPYKLKTSKKLRDKIRWNRAVEEMRNKRTDMILPFDAVI